MIVNTIMRLGIGNFNSERLEQLFSPQVRENNGVRLCFPYYVHPHDALIVDAKLIK